MPRGDKSSYTDKQKRQAEHIEEGYEKRGLSDREAARRAWATVNKETHGGKKSGSGRGKTEDHAPSRKGGRLGGRAAASRPAAARSRSAQKAAATRKRRRVLLTWPRARPLRHGFRPRSPRQPTVEGREHVVDDDHCDDQQWDCQKGAYRPHSQLQKAMARNTASGSRVRLRPSTVGVMRCPRASSARSTMPAR